MVSKAVCYIQICVIYMLSMARRCDSVAGNYQRHMHLYGNATFAYYDFCASNHVTNTRLAWVTWCYVAVRVLHTISRETIPFYTTLCTYLLIVMPTGLIRLLWFISAVYCPVSIAFVIICPLYSS